MIVLCSANEKIRQRWREALAGLSDVVEASRLEALIARLREPSPVLVILHLALPGLKDVTGVTRLRELYPEAKFLVLSDVPGQREGFALLRNGIRGYANTYTSHAYLAEAVKVILLGDVWIGSQLLRGLVEELAQVRTHTDPERSTRAGDSSASGLPGFSRLTAREREIVASLARGESNKGIAAKLGITERTVKAHLSSIFQKTGLKDRLHLALAARAEPVGEAPEDGAPDDRLRKREP